VPLTLPTAILNEILNRCSQDHPDEACGFIARRGETTRLIPMTNTALDPQGGFRLDPSETLTAYTAMDAAGEDPLVLYHSHPAGPAVLSPADVAIAVAAGIPFWLVVSLAGSRPEMAADVRLWRVNGAAVTEAELRGGDVHSDAWPVPV
jgi:proteasome lid subunit RPN8/RPN11